MGRQCVKFSSLWNPRQVPFKLKLVSFGRSPSPRLSHPLLSFGTRSYKSREHEPDSSRIKCCDKDASLGILLKFETWHIVNAFSRSIERLCTQSYKVQMQNQQTNTLWHVTSTLWHEILSKLSYVAYVKSLPGVSQLFKFISPATSGMRFCSFVFYNNTIITNNKVCFVCVTPCDPLSVWSQPSAQC